MSKLTGVFSKFKSLDKIPLTDIATHIRSKGSVQTLEDFLGNRILYPQTLAVSPNDLDIDFAILIEAIKRQPGIFYDVKEGSIIIPEEVEMRFPPIPKLVKIIATALDIQGLVSILVKNAHTKRAGCLLRFPLKEKKDYFELLVNGQNVRVKAPSFSDIKVTSPEITLKVLGLSSNSNLSREMKAVGGPYGLMVDIFTNGK